ncbi:hypothetical protein ACQEU3_39675 [Spirillospora sp. CA-253888]
MELNANGEEVYVNPKWWGFEVVLNAAAAAVAADIVEKIGEIAGHALPKPFGTLIEAALKIRAIVIQAIGKDYGCRLVSPWTAPLMLIPIPLAPKSDTSLWWTVMNASNSWSQDEKFPAHLSKANPALAEFGGKLYCVHRGDGDDKLWWTVYDPARNNGWSTDTAFPDHHSADGPALAVYNGQLYCVHRGGGNDQNLWWTRHNDGGWSTDTRLPGHMSSQSPALAAYSDPNATETQLFCVHRGA